MITDRPSMQQDQHEAHNMPSPDYAGDVLPMPQQLSGEEAAAVRDQNSRASRQGAGGPNVIKIPNDRYK